jgi:hypothetical protein
MGKGPTPRSIIYIYSEGGEQAKPHSHTHHLFAGWVRGQPPGQLYIYIQREVNKQNPILTPITYSLDGQGPNPHLIYLDICHRPPRIQPSVGFIYIFCAEGEGGIFVIIYWLRNNATHCPKN